MPDHDQIYQKEAAHYDRLISRQNDLTELLALIQPPQFCSKFETTIT